MRDEEIGSGCFIHTIIALSYFLNKQVLGNFSVGLDVMTKKMQWAVKYHNLKVIRVHV